MAAFIKIRQHTVGPARGKLGVKPTKTADGLVWSYVNTTVKEDDYLIAHAMVPLSLLQDNGLLSIAHSERLDEVFNRFFAQGFFLSQQDYDFLNVALSAHSLPKVELDNNGLYDQPITAGSRSARPTAESWKLNGKRRFVVFDKLTDEFFVKGKKIYDDYFATKVETGGEPTAAEKSKIRQRALAQLFKAGRKPDNDLSSLLQY